MSKLELIEEVVEDIGEVIEDEVPEDADDLSVSEHGDISDKSSVGSVESDVFEDQTLPKKGKGTSKRKRGEEKGFMDDLYEDDYEDREPRKLPHSFFVVSGFENDLDTFNRLREATGTQTAAIAPIEPAVKNYNGDVIGRATMKYKVKETRIIKSKVTRYIPSNCDSTGKRRSAIEFYKSEGDFHCLWCTEPFHGRPIPAAHYFHQRSNCFAVEHTFCSPACSNAYCRDCRLIPKRQMINQMMLRVLYNIPIHKTQFAPPREALKKFGGYLTIKAFRAKSMENVQCELYNLPLFDSGTGLVELEYIKTKTSKIYEDNFEEIIQKAKRVPSRSVAPAVIAGEGQGYKMQKTTHASMPTLDEQVKLASQLSVKEGGLRIARAEGNKPKKNTLRNYMKKVDPSSEPKTSPVT